MKKILFCNEFSNLNTGYSTYGKQLLTRLHQTGKYTIAEFATYGSIKDIQKANNPWKTYANMPSENSPEWKIYRQRDTNQFGEWRFDRVCLDFKPDIVCDIRDIWMSQHEYMSPYRDFYHWLIMPPIDSGPIKDDWMEMYTDADSVLLYSGWAAQVLKKEGGGKANIVGVTPYGLDYNIYKEYADKKAHRLKMGLPPDALIVGTVMRNQIRKLYPDLFEAFRKYLDTSPAHIADNSYLYIHTSYPDKKGWEIPALIKEFNLSQHILCSYYCKICNKSFSSIFQDARTRCVHCNSLGAVFPNVKEGYTVEQMIDVYNIFDLYVQYSVAEGFGMPILEAAGCGVPVACVDFSAMIDLNNNLNGYKIEVERLQRMIDSNVSRALPNNKSLIDIMIHHFSKSTKELKNQRDATRKLAIKNYNWDTISKIWEFALDKANPAKRSWDDNARLFKINNNVPTNLSNKEFISWALNNVLHEPHMEFTIFGADMLRDLNYGVSLNNNKITEVNREKILQSLASIATNKLNAELARTGQITLDIPDYIKAANK